MYEFHSETMASGYKMAAKADAEITNKRYKNPVQYVYKDYEDPVRYCVKLEYICIITMRRLTDLLLCLDGWLLIIEGMSCELYNLHVVDDVNLSGFVVGQNVPERNTELILSSYRKQRSVIIGNVASKLTLITSPYRKAMLLSKLRKRLAEDDSNIKRRHDIKAPRPKRKNTLNNYNTAVFVHEQLEHIKSRSLPERPQHTTTPVPPPIDNASESNKSKIYGEKKNPNLDNVRPLQEGPFFKRMFNPRRQSDEDIKLSVQASDASPSIDGYRASFEPTVPLPRNLSHAEIVTNVPSNFRNIPGIPDAHQNAASGYQDTTRGTSGGSGASNYNYQNTQRQRDVRSGAFGSNASMSNSQPNNLQSTQRQTNKPARHPEYAYHRDRLQSFSIYRWDEATKPSAEELVNSGLFATDRGDLVRCFQCGLGLKDWAKDDDPLVEHVKYSTDCDFLMQTLGIDKLIRFKDALNPTTATEVAENNHQPAAARNSTLPYAVRSPRYMALEDRMTSFINFPPSITQQHRELALAGLYYTGEDDICRCFTCDGGLKNWVPGDDPMEEHAKYFPQCPYLRHIKGDNFVELVRQRMQAVNVTTASTSSGHAPVPRSVPSPGQSATSSVPVPAFRQAAQASRLDQDVDEILRCPAGRSILQMGYSEEVVRRAIKQLISRGIKQPSAQQTMELILDYEENGETPSVDERNSSVYGASNQPSASEDERTENERLKAMMKCIICKTRERNILCIPCSHHRLCQECARDVTSCPTCGKYIQQKVKTYMS